MKQAIILGVVMALSGTANAQTWGVIHARTEGGPSPRAHVAALMNELEDPTRTLYTPVELSERFESIVSEPTQRAQMAELDELIEVARRGRADIDSADQARMEALWRRIQEQAFVFGTRIGFRAEHADQLLSICMAAAQNLDELGDHQGALQRMTRCHAIAPGAAIPGGGLLSSRMVGLSEEARFALRRATAQAPVIIHSDPPGCNIFIGGFLAGRTPDRRTGLPPGEDYRVRVDCDDARPAPRIHHMRVTTAGAQLSVSYRFDGAINSDRREGLHLEYSTDEERESHQFSDAVRALAPLGVTDALLVHRQQRSVTITYIDIQAGLARAVVSIPATRPNRQVAAGLEALLDGRSVDLTTGLELATPVWEESLGPHEVEDTPEVTLLTPALVAPTQAPIAASDSRSGPGESRAWVAGPVLLGVAGVAATALGAGSFLTDGCEAVASDGTCSYATVARPLPNGLLVGAGAAAIVGAATWGLLGSRSSGERVNVAIGIGSVSVEGRF